MLPDSSSRARRCSHSGLDRLTGRRDIDLLGFGDSDAERVRTLFLDILRTPVENDGVEFDVHSMTVGTIRDDQEYGGVRVLVAARVGTAKLRLQIDVGFGDAITPSAEVVEFPALLEFCAPRLRAYPRETVIAEKLEALVRFGMANSRMKDRFDMVLLSRMFDFDGALLVRAIAATFERRGTPVPTETPVGLTEAFATDPMKRTQWTAFLRKCGSREKLGDLGEVTHDLGAFLSEPLGALSKGSSITSRWPRGGPWSA